MQSGNSVFTPFRAIKYHMRDDQIPNFVTFSLYLFIIVNITGQIMYIEKTEFTNLISQDMHITGHKP